MLQGGAVGVLMFVIVGVILGRILPAATVDRLERRYQAEIDNLKTERDQWRETARRADEALQTALRANELTAQQVDRLAVGTELTERLIDTMRRQVGERVTTVERVIER